MRRAAQESLKALGMERHQALVVSHRDGQPHVHVIANRMDPESGSRQSSLSCFIYKLVRRTCLPMFPVKYPSMQSGRHDTSNTGCGRFRSVLSGRCRRLSASDEWDTRARLAGPSDLQRPPTHAVRRRSPRPIAAAPCTRPCQSHRYCASRLWWYSTQANTIPYKSIIASSVLTCVTSSVRFLSPSTTYLQRSKSSWCTSMT